MASFVYQAKDKNGKDTQGVVEAVDQKIALAILREKGQVCYSLKEKKDNIFSFLAKRFFQKISLVEIATFTRQLATMVEAGLPLTEALVILKTQGKGLMSATADNVLRDVEGGSALAEALRKYPRAFSPVYVALVKAGESAGVLDNILVRLADNLEAQREFRAKVKGALIYPVIIVMGMVAVMFIMMIFVMPKLTSLYAEFDAKLPASTKILMAISNFMVSYWWLPLLAAVGLGYLYRLIDATEDGKKKLDMMKFKIPLVGKLQNQVMLAELTRTLGLLVGAGVSIVEALEISAQTANNSLIEDGISKATKQVEKGLPLSSSLQDNPVFPPIVSQMISVGEETGKMDEVLLKVSRYFQSESEETLKGLTTAIEPLIMVVLGIGVGFLVISVIMPIYNLTSQF